MAITNRAESAIFKVLGVFAEFAKSLGFCFVQKKRKTKPKGFAKFVAESLVRVRRPTCHSRTVVTNTQSDSKWNI